MKLVLAHLFPSVMTQYGDQGNLICLLQRAAWRGVEVQLETLEVADRLDPDVVDLLLMGGGADTYQRMICEDLVSRKGQGIRAAVESGAAALMVCAAYQLCGERYTTAEGSDLTGIGLFDAHTIHRAAELGARMDTVSAAGALRAVGNLVVESHCGTLVGFENHGGRTYLHQGASPLGRVKVGGGNNSLDGSEGCRYRAAIGTYLHGPVLPKNPALADFLIEVALCRRYGEVRLEPVDDSLGCTDRTRALEIAYAGARRRPPVPLRWPQRRRR